MNKAIKPAILPYITLGAGAAGAALRFWLLAPANGAHLLPAGHPARTLPVILSLLLLAVLFIGTRPLVQAHKYGFNFPASLPGAIGIAAAAIAIGITCAGELAASADSFSRLAAICGLLAAPCLLFVAYCRSKGYHPSLVFHVAVCVFLMIRLVSLYRTWSADPQLEDFMYQLLAVVFCLLSCYHRAAFDANFGSRREYTFYTLACLYFCCLALPGCSQFPFYIGIGIWMATNLCSLLPLYGSAPAAEEDPNAAA